MERITSYVGAVAVAAVALLAVIDWGSLSVPADDILGLVALVILGLVSESLSVRTAVRGSAGTFTITFIPLLTGVILFGPDVAVLLFLSVGVVAEFVVHKKPAVKATFNSAQYVISSSLGGVAYTAVAASGILGGGPGSETLLSDPPIGATALIVAFIAFGVVFLALNHALVAGAIAISRRSPFYGVWGELVGPSGSNIFYDLLISPISIAVAYLYVSLEIWGLLLVILPMLFIRHFYLINFRLIRANQDLLSALVKAIETRDPYTSGHSMRVARLSRSIAKAMGVPQRRLDRIEQSALLHDIGKIDAIYTEILKKPDSLSSEERSIIESHVTKGVELLQTLSSVPGAVIADVRHHHERVDGKGYPDGLSGKDIPLGARIIKVSDAVDAMLSDRPYRNALDLETVRRELVLYSGSQFDEDVVRAIIDTDVLERHQAEVKVAERRSGSAPTGATVDTETAQDIGLVQS